MYKKVFPWVAVILCWMGLIFYLSHQPATDSNSLSLGVTGTITRIIEIFMPHADIDMNRFNHIVRKNAHFFVYLVLAIFVAGAFKRFGFTGYRKMGLALLCCVVFAISDETHQLFVSGRGGQLKDVLIDSAGACVGLGIYYILSRMRKLFRRMKR